MCEHCASTDGARRAQNCALYTSVCFVVSVPLFAMCSRLFMSVCRSQMFVNMRCRIHSLYIFHSAYCSLSNPICSRSVWCRRTIIPGKIFTSFAKVQGTVSVNGFRLPIRLQELLQAPLCFLGSFCFCTDTPGSIGWLDPVPRLRIDDCFEIQNLH